jgi:hypothetical protein
MKAYTNAKSGPMECRVVMKLLRKLQCCGSGTQGFGSGTQGYGSGTGLKTYQKLS